MAHRGDSASRDGARWLDDTQGTFGEQTKKQLRDSERQRVVGGLRSPHKSIGHLPNATTAVAKVKNILDDVVDSHWIVATEALATVGMGPMPSVLTDLARTCREKLRDSFGVAAEPEAG